MHKRTCRNARRSSAAWIASTTAGVAAALVMPSPADAAIVSWNQPLGGNWGSLFWTGGVGTNPPTATDFAAFNLAATYNITMSVAPTISGMSIGGSNVTFLGTQFGPTLTNNGGLSVSSGSFNLTGSPINWTNTSTMFFNANATVSNGNDLSGAGMGVGGSATAIFNGVGTTLGTTPNGISVDGVNPTLTFSNGASGVSGAINISNGAAAGTANLNVQSGATLSSQGLTMATNAVASKVANVTVTGAGSTVTNTGAMTIGASALSSATMTLSSGGAVTTSGGDLNVTSTGVIDIQSGGVFTIVSRAVALGSGNGTQGKILVSGAGSNFSQTGNVGVTVGGAGGSAAAVQTSAGAIVSTGASGMTINSAGLVDVAGGTLNLNGNATVNGTLQRGTGGTLNWAASKTMSVQNGGDVLISGAYSLPNNASVTVTGAGSSLAQNTSGMLTFGSGSALNIATGATVTTLAERLSDGTGATINQSGGTHNVLGGGGSSALVIGFGFGSTDSYNLSGGSLSVTNDTAGVAGEIVGNFGAGNFIHTGGSHSVNGGNGSLVIGAASTGVGTYSLSNNAGLDCASIDVGRDSGATGTLTLASGSNAFVLALQEFLELGLNFAASGTVNANGGYVGANGIFVGGTSTAAGGTGVLNVAGGQVDAALVPGLANSGQLRVWNTTGSAINLSAGMLSCDTLITSGNPSRFHWTGNGRLNITGSGGFDISATGPLGANLVLDGGKQLFVTNTTNIAPGASLALVGSSTFFTGSLTGNGALSSDLGSILVGSDNTSTTFTGTITGDGAFAKTGSGTQTISFARIYHVSVNDGTLRVGPTGGSPDRTSVVSRLSLSGNGRLDLTDNKMIVLFGDLGVATGGTYSGLTGLIQKSYNFGAWDAPGLTTSRPAAASGLTTLAIADADATGYVGGTFGGVSVGSDDVIVMYTYAGDANLDGVIDGGDYGVIDNFIQVPGVAGYANGDFNYDGVIDGGDYGIIDNNVQAQGAPFPTSGSAGLSAVTAVPEPSASGFALLAAATTAITRRRRRRAWDYVICPTRGGMRFRAKLNAFPLVISRAAG